MTFGMDDARKIIAAGNELLEGLIERTRAASIPGTPEFLPYELRASIVGSACKSQLSPDQAYLLVALALERIVRAEGFEEAVPRAK